VRIAAAREPRAFIRPRRARALSPAWVTGMPLSISRPFASATRFALLLAGSVPLAACAEGPMIYEIPNVRPMNRALDYLPWDANGGVGNELTIRPGMRLRIHHAGVRRAEASGGTGFTSQPPSPAQYDWIVPATGGAYEGGDYFVLSYMLSMGLPESHSFEDANGIAWLHAVGGSLADTPDFASSLGRATLDRILPSLRLRITRSQRAPSPDGSAELVRAWLTRGSRDDFMKQPDNAQASFRALMVTVPTSAGAVDLALFDGNTAFFNNNVRYDENRSNLNAWFTKKTFDARALVDVEVPVRVEPELSSRFFPVYFSVADVEARLGVRVSGVQRRESFLRPGLTATSVRHRVPGLFKSGLPSDGIIPTAVLLRDHAFTLWFAEPPGEGEREMAGSVLHAPGTEKRDLLLAPGDVLILGGRTAPTDRPEVR
jgi:hypothetical protein